jgi:hypothetical protein
MIYESPSRCVFTDRFIAKLITRTSFQLLHDSDEHEVKGLKDVSGIGRKHRGQGLILAETYASGEYSRTDDFRTQRTWRAIGEDNEQLRFALRRVGISLDKSLILGP